MTVEKPKPKLLLRPITTGANSAMNQSRFLAITCNSLKAREKSRVHSAIGFGFGFGFASQWLENWRESFKPITKRGNRNHVMTSDSHLKTALSTALMPNFRVSIPHWYGTSLSLQTKPFIPQYGKIPKISPGAYTFQRPFLRGLFLEGLIFGGASIRWKICVTNPVGLAYSSKVSFKKTCYRIVFALFYFVFEGNFQV